MGFFFLLLHGEANDENRSKERRIPHYIPLETIFSGWAWHSSYHLFLRVNAMPVPTGKNGFGVYIEYQLILFGLFLGFWSSCFYVMICVPGPRV